jgi:hypothetical protein
MPPSRDSFRRNRVAPIDESILSRRRELGGLVRCDSRTVSKLAGSSSDVDSGWKMNATLVHDTSAWHFARTLNERPCEYPEATGATIRPRKELTRLYSLEKIRSSTLSRRRPSLHRRLR